jgi:hypothetical protein
MKVFIPKYNNWFTILERNGNFAKIDFYGKKIVFNIIGYETKNVQTTLF